METEDIGGARSLERRTVRRLVIVALSYRALATSAAVSGIAASGTLDGAPLTVLVGVTATVLAGHGVVLLVPRVRARLPARSGGAFAVDIGVAATLSLWAATIIPDQTLFFDYRNPFSGYVVGNAGAVDRAAWSAGRRGAARCAGRATARGHGVAERHRPRIDRLRRGSSRGACGWSRRTP